MATLRPHQWWLALRTGHLRLGKPERDLRLSFCAAYQDRDGCGIRAQRCLPRLSAPRNYVVPLHEYPGTLRNGLSRRHRRPACPMPDGLQCMVRGLSWRPLVDFDARHNVPRIGRVLMATGRDAADVAITTSFGTSMLKKFTVVTDEVTESGQMTHAAGEATAHAF